LLFVPFIVGWFGLCPAAIRASIIRLKANHSLVRTFSLSNTFKSCKSVSKPGLLKVLKQEFMVFFTF